MRMILNIMIAHRRKKIKPAFSDPTLVLRWVVIDGAGTSPEVPLFKGWLFGGRPQN